MQISTAAPVVPPSSRSAELVSALAPRLAEVEAGFSKASHIGGYIVLDDVFGGIGRGRAIRSVRDAATAARRILDELVPLEPAFQGASDTIDGVRDLQQHVRRPGLGAVTYAHDDLRVAQTSIGAWSRVQGMDESERRTALRGFFDRSPAAMTSDDWLVLGGIAQSDVDGALDPTIPRIWEDRPGEADPRRLSVDALRESDRLRLFPSARRAESSARSIPGMFWALRDAGSAPLEERQHRVAELLSGDPSARTRPEWEELSLLLRTKGVDVPTHEWFPGVPAVVGVDRVAVRGSYSRGAFEASVSPSAPAGSDSAP